jgi:uroporphyrinogen III methyltransferase/synthase
VGRRDGMGPTTYRLHPAVLQRAKAGKTVVRLKSGDPLLFGRGGEEAEDLRNAGIPFEIVPGITAALGAASYAGIPLTQRGEASQVLLGAGHEPEKWPSGSEEDLQQRTTVLYMAARRLSANLNRLQAEGYAAETPAALVMSATTARQRVVSGTLGTLAQLVPALDPEIPAILLVGRVVARRRYVAWFEPEQPRDFDTSSSEERPDSSEMSTEHGGALREAATGSTR